MSLKMTRRQYVEMFGPTVGDQVRLADAELFVEVERDLIAEAGARGDEVKNTRKVTKCDLLWNDTLPKMEVDPETYTVKTDGRVLTCEPATVLPMAQRYFLF